MGRWLTWNVFFPLQEKLKGHPTFEILREMEAADLLSASELEQLRNRKLQDLISYCHAHVPYIRTLMQERGIQPGRVRDPRDLTLFPIMSKALMRKHRMDLRTELGAEFTSSATGGSTGDPLIFDLAKRRIGSRVACRQRVARWWGVSVGDSEIALWGSPVELTRQDRLRRLRDKLLATRLLSAFELSESTMSHYLDILEQHPCRQIFAYPSAIYMLCRHARKQKRNLRGLGIKVVFVTSEVLYPHQRELVSETLNCPVADGYGGRDSGFISHECPQGGMHIISDAVIVEVVNSEGQPLPPGESGEIVVTDLYSHEAPFLRYATGDTGVLSSRRCPCGRPHPLIERICGRSNDSITAPDGRIINDQSLVYLLREVDGIEQFRIYQRQPDCFHVQVVPTDDFRKEGEDKIRTGWSKLLRSPLRITFEYLPSLPREVSGKFRHIVSELPGAQAALTTEEDRTTSR